MGRIQLETVGSSNRQRGNGNGAGLPDIAFDVSSSPSNSFPGLSLKRHPLIEEGFGVGRFVSFWHAEVPFYLAEHHSR